MVSCDNLVEGFREMRHINSQNKILSFLEKRLRLNNVLYSHFEVKCSPEVYTLYEFSKLRLTFYVLIVERALSPDQSFFLTYFSLFWRLLLVSICLEDFVFLVFSHHFGVFSNSFWYFDRNVSISFLDVASQVVRDVENLLLNSLRNFFWTEIYSKTGF